VGTFFTSSAEAVLPRRKNSRATACGRQEGCLTPTYALGNPVRNSGAYCGKQISQH